MTEKTHIEETQKDSKKEKAQTLSGESTGKKEPDKVKPKEGDTSQKTEVKEKSEASKKEKELVD